MKKRFSVLISLTTRLDHTNTEMQMVQDQRARKVGPLPVELSEPKVDIV